MSSRAVTVLLLCGLALAAGALLPIASGASSFPVLPVADGSALLSNLSAPPLAPGASEGFGFTLRNPFAVAMLNVTLAFGVYEFVPYPGNASAPLPSGGTPALEGGYFNGTDRIVFDPELASGTTLSSRSGPTLTLVVPASAPQGTYAIRSSLTFSEGSTPYRFESRGFFSPAAWRNATLLPNGSPTLNLSRLGVSGVLPETAVQVQSATIDPVLYGLLAGAFVLAGAGGYVAWRRGRGSRSGARTPEGPQSAPSTLGKRRTRDGD